MWGSSNPHSKFRLAGIRKSSWKRWKMENLLVGEYPCKVDKLFSIFRQKSPVKMWSKLIELARSLQMSYKSLNWIRKSIIADSLKYEDAFYIILKEWQRKEAEKATLSSLVAVLNIHGLHEYADALKDAFENYISNQLEDEGDEEYFTSKALVGEKQMYREGRVDTDNKYAESNKDVSESINIISKSDRKDVREGIATMAGRELQSRQEMVQGTSSNEIPTEVYGTSIKFFKNEELGRGSTSIVYKGLVGRKPAAVKRINSRYADIYQNELDNWQDMFGGTTEAGNLHIVALYQWAHLVEMGGTFYYLAMERAICDLESRIQDLKTLMNLQSSESETKDRLIEIIHGAAKGLLWIHNQGFLHRDIKPENIFIFETSSKAEIAKLGDFGITKKLEESESMPTSGTKGTVNWMAPEALKAVQFRKKIAATKAADIFSLGMTAHYAMSVGVHPFGESEKYGTFINMNIVKEKINPARLGHPSFPQDHLLQWMMSKAETERPSIEAVEKHPSFWDWEKSLQFIMDVATSLETERTNTNPEVANIRNQIDKGYQKDWSTNISPEYQKCLFQHKKEYNANENSHCLSTLRNNEKYFVGFNIPPYTVL
ncbi:Serine/threonine-protein kinase ppk4 [Orchesella cincta]|uniref:Serine/threonine-protein kinase ppk4 n=1 Tax=Orchesella cincta TaxID=48709 RepID=A0A1D2MGU4_ORCCI|nr:Serine/threonine-protein kinase ppk4 [Orchesella cincta]